MLPNPLIFPVPFSSLLHLSSLPPPPTPHTHTSLPPSPPPPPPHTHTHILASIPPPPPPPTHTHPCLHLLRPSPAPRLVEVPRIMKRLPWLCCSPSSPTPPLPPRSVIDCKLTPSLVPRWGGCGLGTRLADTWRQLLPMFQI